MMSLLFSCADDIGVEGNLPSGDGQHTGEMVLFAAGTTSNAVNSRAGGVSETPGATYYMPDAYRFVCRMYYMAATGSDKFDTQGGTDYITWLKVKGDKGNSLYWSNNFLPTDDVDSYGNDAKGVYCYRLKGLDREWTRMRPGEHSVRYSALPSGTYTFEVKYQSAISGSEVATASIEVRVSPYFWKSWWFLLLVMICITIVATLLYKRRMAVIRERETLRLLTPIREALENSDNPEVTQERIRKILDNQKRYHENYVRIAEEDQQQEASKRRSFLDRLMMVMKEQYMNSELDGDHLADALGMSRSLLVKKMKSETGQTTSQFIKDYRLNIAREMLSHNEGIRNITEIAYRVGFNDPKYFTRCFTKKYGISPSSYVDSMTK